MMNQSILTIRRRSVFVGAGGPHTNVRILRRSDIVNQIGNVQRYCRVQSVVPLVLGPKYIACDSKLSFHVIDNFIRNRVPINHEMNYQGQGAMINSREYIERNQVLKIRLISQALFKLMQDDIWALHCGGYSQFDLKVAPVPKFYSGLVSIWLNRSRTGGGLGVEDRRRWGKRGLGKWFRESPIDLKC